MEKVELKVKRCPRADSRRNRERVLQAAVDLLSDGSVIDLTMEDVARSASVGRGTLYRHFATRERLFAAVIQDGGAHLILLLRDKIPPDGTAPAKLKALLGVLYDCFEQHHINVDLLISHRRDVATDHELEGHPAGELRLRVRGIIEQGIREGCFRPLDLDYAVSAVLTLLNPLAFIRTHSRLGCSRAGLEEQAFDFLLHALRRDSGAPI
jgi:AcrR family transcriptional regulator